MIARKLIAWSIVVLTFLAPGLESLTHVVPVVGTLFGVLALAGIFFEPVVHSLAAAIYGDDTRS